MTEHITNTFVCCPCRWTVSRPTFGEGMPLCSKCGGEMWDAGRDFKTPKKRDDAGWKKVQERRKRSAEWALPHMQKVRLRREGMFKKS